MLAFSIVYEKKKTWTINYFLIYSKNEKGHRSVLGWTIGLNEIIGGQGEGSVTKLKENSQHDDRNENGLTA